MLYLLYLRLAEHQHYVPVLNLLKYLTFRTGMSVVTAQLIVVAMGSRFIRWMQARCRVERARPIRNLDGIERHIIEKAGTPTMGGLMILAGLIGGTLLWGDLTSVYVWTALMVTAGYGLLGFSDDYAKVTKQTTDGLSGWARLGIEFALAAVASAIMIKFGPVSHDTPGLATSVAFPVFKALLINLGWFYVAFAGFVIVGAANAVNFTDGLDGLAIVPVMIAAAAFSAIAYLVGNFVFAGYLQVHFPALRRRRAGGVLRRDHRLRAWVPLVQCPAGQDLHGRHGFAGPGRGAGRAVAVACKHEFVLAIVGGLFVAEALSVIIQVAYFKRTGRRVFLMAPIHHHFEKLGWAESTVVVRFWIVAIMLAMLGLATLKLR